MVAELFRNAAILSLNTVLPLETQTAYFKETGLALCGEQSPEDSMANVQAKFERENRSQGPVDRGGDRDCSVPAPPRRPVGPRRCFPP